MKKLGIIFYLGLLTGCTSISFDGNQFDRYISVYESAEKLQKLCSTDSSAIIKELNSLSSLTSHMKTYASFRTNSPEVAIATASISDMVIEAVDRFNQSSVSTTYCETKFGTIKDAAKTVSATLGAQ